MEQQLKARKQENRVSFFDNLEETTQFIKDLIKSNMIDNVNFKNSPKNNKIFRVQINLKDGSALLIRISNTKPEYIFYSFNLKNQHGHMLTHINGDFEKDVPPLEYIELKQQLIDLFKYYMTHSI